MVGMIWLCYINQKYNGGTVKVVINAGGKVHVKQ